MALTPSQNNNLMDAYNKAILQQQYSGGPAGSGSFWGGYNNLLDKYGTGNGSGAGVPGFAGGVGGSGGSNVILGGTGQNGGPINFNLNPQPQGGAGTFGAVPGAIGAPPSIWQQEQGIPGVAGLTGQTTGLIGSQLNGNLSPSTIGNLTDAAAARGVSLGQGGSSGLTNEILLKTLGLTHEGLQQQGMGNYLNFLGTTGSQQQNPQLLAEIASRNATMAAAPNPTLASEYLMGLSRGTGTSLRNPFAGLNLGGGSSPTITGTSGFNPFSLSSGMNYGVNPASGGGGYMNTGPYPGGPQQDTGFNDANFDSYYNSDIPAGTYMGEDSYSSPDSQAANDVWNVDNAFE